ncbi:MAG: cupin domain-containing protein [Planctomycetes bacterium]|nr:cupin domain-containing protein [Planctomycetota bacterium]
MRFIHRRTPDSSRVRALGPYHIEALLDEAEEGLATAYRVRIEPGQTTDVSFHKIAEEFYFVLAGSGVAVIDGTPVKLLPGDFLRLPPGTTHGFITHDEALEMLDIHTPGCRPDRDTYFAGQTPPGFGLKEKSHEPVPE